MTAPSNPINRLLHLAKTPIATLHRVRGRRQKFVAQKLKALLQSRRFQLLQHRRQSFESLQPLPQFAQLIQSRRPATPPIIQSVHLVDDLTQPAEFRQASHDFLQRSAFLRCQLFLNEKISIVEQRPDFRLNSLVFPDRPLLFLVRRTSPLRPFRLGFFKLPTHLGDRFQNGFVDLFFDVPCCEIRTNLMPDAVKHRLNRLRIERRTVRRDAVQDQFSFRQNTMKRTRQIKDVPGFQIVRQDAAKQPLIRAIIGRRQGAEWSVVHFVDGDVAGKLSNAQSR